MTERTEIKFTEIVQMIADGTVPEGAKFYKRDGGYAELNNGVLKWDTGGYTGVSEYLTSSEWYMEVPEQQLTLAEAIEEWRKGDLVKVVYDGVYAVVSSFDDFDDIYELTELSDLDDLLFNSEYYKVQ